MPAIPVYRDPVGEVILAGTSLTPDSDGVVRAAAAVAEALGARLHLAHFLPSPELPPEIGDLVPSLAPRPEEERERDAVEALLEQIERTGIEPALICGTTVTGGVAHRLLSRMAASLDASLVVVGAREPTGAASRLLGSTAERVVRSGVAPVLVVRDELAMPPSALATVDLSPASAAAFGAGLHWLARLDASEVTALFVVSPFQGAGGGRGGGLRDRRRRRPRRAGAVVRGARRRPLPAGRGGGAARRAAARTSSRRRRAAAAT